MQARRDNVQDQCYPISCIYTLMKHTNNNAMQNSIYLQKKSHILNRKGRTQPKLPYAGQTLVACQRLLYLVLGGHRPSQAITQTLSTHKQRNATRNQQPRRRTQPRPAHEISSTNGHRCRAHGSTQVGRTKAQRGWQRLGKHVAENLTGHEVPLCWREAFPTVPDCVFRCWSRLNAPC
jgi:hypothetical protein